MEEDQAFNFIVVVVVVTAVISSGRRGKENKFDFGYVDFKVMVIFQVETGTRQLHIWVYIPE